MAPGLTLPILWPLDKIMRYYKIQFAKDTQLIEILLMPFTSNYSNGVTEAKLGCLGAFLERGFLFVPLPQVSHLIWLTVYTAICSVGSTCSCFCQSFGRQTWRRVEIKLLRLQVHFRAELRPENFGRLGCRFQGPAPDTFLSYTAVLRSKSSFTGGWSDEQSVRFSKVDARCRATVWPGDSGGNFFMRYAFHSRSFAFQRGWFCFTMPEVR